MTDYYATLGVAKTATAAEIKQAFRRLASQHHPDKGGDTQKFQEIQAAYAVLGDEQKRAEYDNPRPQFGGFGGMGGHEVNINDIFGQMFGGMRMHPRQQTPRLNLWVTLEDVARGGPKVVALQVGNRVSNIEINIPAGINDGDTVRYAKLSPDGNDLVITFRVRPDPVWHREGKNITTERTVPIWTLITGGEIIVTDLKGSDLALSIPAHTQPGSLLRARGRGLPGQSSPGAGDLFIKIQAKLPDRISPELMAAIKQETEKNAINQ